VPLSNPLASRQEVTIEDLRAEKIIAFKRQNLSYTERYFAETFEEHGLNDNVAYTCDDTFSLISLVSSGLGVGFAPEWTGDLPGRDVVLKKAARLRDQQTLFSGLVATLSCRPTISFNM
jgi:DNA-binding transcriptional LysR family regulator